MTVERALAYHRLMIAEGLTEPHRVLTAPPAKASRWKPRQQAPKEAASTKTKAAANLIETCRRLKLTSFRWCPVTGDA